MPVFSCFASNFRYKMMKGGLIRLINFFLEISIIFAIPRLLPVQFSAV